MNIGNRVPIIFIILAAAAVSLTGCMTCRHENTTIAENEPATCTREGHTVLICDKCGESLEGIIQPLGHQYEVTTEATCSENGLQTCTRCGKEETLIAEHEYDSKTLQCIYCGENKHGHFEKRDYGFTETDYEYWSGYISEYGLYCRGLGRCAYLGMDSEGYVYTLSEGSGCLLAEKVTDWEHVNPQKYHIMRVYPNGIAEDYEENTMNILLSRTIDGAEINGKVPVPPEVKALTIYHEVE